MIYWLWKLPLWRHKTPQMFSGSLAKRSLSTGFPRSLRVLRVAARGSAETDQNCLGRNSQTQFYAVVAIPPFHLKALVFLYAFEEWVDCHLLSSFCDDSSLHISLFKYVLSKMGVSKESISKFLIGNRFHVKLRIHSPENCKQSLQVKSWKAEATAEKTKLKTTIEIS